MSNEDNGQRKWDCRLVRDEDRGLEFHEVLVEDGKVIALGEPLWRWGNVVGMEEQVLARMKHAMSQPVVNPNEIPKTMEQEQIMDIVYDMIDSLEDEIGGTIGQPENRDLLFENIHKAVIEYLGGGEVEEDNHGE
jgi:hypothetical protein